MTVKTIARSAAVALAATLFASAVTPVLAASAPIRVLTYVPPRLEPHGNSSPMIHHEQPFEVCFYSGVKFTQQHFCVNDQERMGYVEPDWRHRIKSVKVIGPDVPNVKLCSEPSLGGKCIYVGFKKEMLPEGLLDHVHSYRIR